MNYELLLLRHGKSDWNTPHSDFDRPITDRGKRGAQRIGVWLAQNDLQPDDVISSPAERAKTTAQKMMKAMGATDHHIIYDARLYDATLQHLLDVIKDIPKTSKRVILVAHNPGLELLLSYLCNKKIAIPEDGKLLPTATIAHMTLPCHWGKIKKNTAILKTIIRPKSLPKKFPYPNAKGKEKRIRPAYYYTQSSVIPYQIKRGKIEILLILSSKKNHYVVPKGIKEPGLSAKASAAKEALEEAGVKGKITAKALGQYIYQKWDAPCEVTVYGMEVTTMIDETDWEEKHRGRTWVTPKEAMNKLYQKELSSMIPTLEKIINSKPL